MNKLKIAVIPGDGTGPEVTAEALKVLKAVASLEGFQYELEEFDFGGQRYLRTGDVLPDGAVEQLRSFAAILMGAVGHPDVAPGILEKGLLLELRFQLDQYINLRPVKLYPGVATPLAGKGPRDIDFVVVRENTEDMYCGIGGFLKKGTPDEVAMQTAIYTRKGCERCIRWAFDFTRKRNNPKETADAGGQDQRADLSVTTSGGARSMRWPRSIPTSSPTTTTSMPAACGWSRTRNTTT